MTQGKSRWVEIKSASLVIDGVARFPDAPTVRGRRHVDALAALAAQGIAAAVVFMVQRPDAHAFRPYSERDPELGEALRRAEAAGVGLYAYTCGLTQEAIWVENPIPVLL